MVGGSMTNIIMAKSDPGTGGAITTYYLDTAAELSKLNRKNHKQVADNGKPLMYDLSIEISTPQFANSNVPILTGQIFTAPDHWITRNAVRQAHFLREDLRKEAGVQKGSIGRYAKNLRLNLDTAMTAITYDNTTATSGTTRRIYAQNEVSYVHSAAGQDVTGGTWDYTQLTQTDPTNAIVGDPYYLSVCSAHSAAAPGPYTRVGVNLAYLQRRQTVLEDSTQTSGGVTVNVDSDSPFFRIPEQDAGEDAYQLLILDEQDNPPYARAVDLSNVSESADIAPICVDNFQLGAGGQATNGSAHVARVQAPLGLVMLKMDPVASASFEDIHFQITCHGTYEM
jgi:hypothetical protein